MKRQPRRGAMIRMTLQAKAVGVLIVIAAVELFISDSVRLGVRTRVIRSERHAQSDAA
jgi:hypothetical protein